MKKIFRMALVFALAGATLMYTGCTKDYTEDINSLEKKVNDLSADLSAKVADLAGQVSTLKSSVATLESTLSTLSGDVSTLKTKVAALETAVANAATKDDVAALETKIANLKTEILAVTDGLQAQLNELKGYTEEQIAALQAALDEVYAALGDGLTSIVFIPDFYYGGIEATSYDFADLTVYDRVKEAVETTDHQQAAVKFPATATTSFKENAKAAYSLGQVGIANYDINPSTFPLDSATWALHGMDQKYVPVVIEEEAEEEGEGEEPTPTKAETKTWKPVFEGIEYKVAKNGIPYAAVNYSIENPELLAYGENVPVMHLEATLADGKFVSSDWEAVISGNETIAHLAFDKANDYTTAAEEQCEISEDKDLYLTAKETAENIPSIDVKWNGGGIDLAPLVAIHVDNETTGLTEYTLEALQAKYPGFDYTFELVPFTSGKNVTGEEYYGNIEGSWFTPCWVSSVDGKPVSNKIPAGSEDGISAVGRTPIVLVTLVRDGKVSAYGYFKIEIVNKDSSTTVLGPIDLGKVPFVCEPQKLGITWYDFSHFVLENLKMDYNQFTATYEYDDESAYVLDEDGKYVAVGDKYGEIVYTKDDVEGTINDIFEWTIDPQEIGEGESQTIFVRFKNKSNERDQVFFELTAEVAAAAKFDFGANKISNEWFDDINGEVKNTARINVPVPVADQDDPVKGGDVRKFQRDLNHFFVGYSPAVTLTADSDPIYKEVDEELLETTSIYYFSDVQNQNFVDRDGNVFTFFTNEAGDSLFVAAKFAADSSIVADATVKVGTKDNLIAYLTVEESDDAAAEEGETEEGEAEEGEAEEGEDAEEEEAVQNNVIVYSWAKGTTMAKYFLNQWGYKETLQERMLYANILVETTYGECKIPAGTEGFHVRFIRPLDIELGAQDTAEESAVDGAIVEIVKFVKGISDWNNQPVIELKNGKFGPAIIKTIDMYAYYQFESLIIDMKNAKRNNWDTTAEDPATVYDFVSKITPKAKLQVGKLAEDGTFDASAAESYYDEETGVYTLPIKEFSDLDGFVINYRNDEAYVDEFQVKIPVKIAYAWGTYVAEFVVNIKTTGNTQPGK